MKLLFDVHHSPRAAERLREQGHDVVAAADVAVLASLTDEDLLHAATAEGRVLVTENVKDFDRIVVAWTALGRHHAGVIFTSPRFHRGSLAYPANLVAALDRLLTSAPDHGEDWVHWLS